MCSKTIVRILGGVLMLWGVIVLIVGITVATGSSWISDLMPEDTVGADEDAVEFADGAASLGKAFEALVIVFGLYMLVMGFMACWVCGHKCEGNCILVILFQVFMLILFVVTLVIAAMPFGFYMIDNDDMNWFCDTSKAEMDTFYAVPENESSSSEMLLMAKTYVDDADSVILARDAIMCSSSCPCLVDDWDFWGENFDTTYLYIDYIQGVVDWEECQEMLDLEGETNQIEVYFDGILGLLEEDFECQGICSTGRFWLFSEVEDGPPTESCLVQLHKDFTSSSLAGSIIMFITCLVDLLLFICMFGMFKKGEEKDKL